ncbi:MAG: ACP S-malonyltransferase [Bacteroidia bacterium]|nr:ACP S-malonyltransferase [Bacteroidia bacterium]
MKTALVFPGQGAQFSGMGKDLYEKSESARKMFAEANEILGFDIAEIMFSGSDDQLRQTSVTQPAIYIHSVILNEVMGLGKEAHMAAGHSLGEFSALAAAGVLSFGDGLNLVAIRANAMQKACDAAPSTMAAIVGLDDEIVEEVCAEISEIVVPANYNSPGQLVISGSIEGINQACEALKARGARRALVLNVNGAFHSPLMQPAQEELEAGIRATQFSDARIPVYQNFTAKPETAAAKIQENLIAQLTGPVRWTQCVTQMTADGAEKYIELGPGKVLQGLIPRISKGVEAIGYQSLP